MVRLVALSALVPAVVAQITSTSFGCYTESHGRTGVRALAGNFTIDYVETTLESCEEFCLVTHASEAYTLWGVQYGGECFCGTALTSGSFPTFATDCNVNCPGDLTGTTKCGGGNRISLYGTGSTAPAFTPFSVPGGPYDTLEDLGCYTEGDGVRALADASASSNTLMTVEGCANYCLWGGYKYAGLEYFHECWCANSIHNTSVPASAGDCNAPCTGNSAQTCGGGNRLSIHEWTLAPPPPPPRKMVRGGAY